MNSAYRGDSARRGWTHEADLLAGQRTDPETLARDLRGLTPAIVLVLREHAAGAILASVFLERVVKPNGVSCYLSMLSVAPASQDRGLGRALMARAEDVARDWGATHMIMTVISLRTELIAYYERRGYRRTGETLPFPCDNPLFGRPKRDDLAFVVVDKPL